jgi:hypothetical protein
MPLRDLSLYVVRISSDNWSALLGEASRSHPNASSRSGPDENLDGPHVARRSVDTAQALNQDVAVFEGGGGQRAGPLRRAGAAATEEDGVTRPGKVVRGL